MASRSQDSSVDAASRIDLPLDPILKRSARGWQIRIPVRAEQVQVHKRAVVREEIRVKTTPERRRVRLTGRVRREVADIELDGQLEARRPEVSPTERDAGFDVQDRRPR